MEQNLGNLQDAFTELNININTEEDPQSFLLPRWKDITSFLDEATQDFDVGQLVHLPSFTLFDAMSAIEVMNPRMDTGMLVENTSSEFDIQKRLTLKQTLNIMDRLVTREMAWIAGHSLSQTVYTCIYFHHISKLNEIPMPSIDSKLEDIVYGVLKSYILATAKCCHYIFMEMSQGNTYEEEDFTTNLFGLSFNDQNPDFMICNDVDASILLLKKSIENGVSDEPLVQELLYRMELRKSYLLSLIYLSQKDAPFLNQAHNELTKIQELLPKINLSLSEEFNDAFDANMNRKLTSQTPPRPVELSSEIESFKEYSLLIDRLSFICKIIDFPSITSLMNNFNYFGSKKPYPDAFSRSKLNTLFYQDNRIFGNMTVPKVILTSIKETVQPPAWWIVPQVNLAPPNVNPVEFMQAHDTLKNYLNRISLMFLEFFKINCHNRSRQRRLLNKILPEWEVLQEEIAGIDDIFHNLQKDKDGNPIDTPYHFSSWAYNLKLNMMEKYLFLGFELDLYGSHEYIMIYWYIQCITSGHAFLLERMSEYIDQSVDITDVVGYLRTNQLYNHAKKILCEAILKILVLTKYTKQFKPNRLVYDDEETRFNHRFKSFSQLASPPPPTYEIFLETVEVNTIEVSSMVKVITQDLAEAKRILDAVLTMTEKESNSEMFHKEYKEEIKNIIRTVVANRIGLNIISEKADKADIDIQFKYHPWFPIITKKV